MLGPLGPSFNLAVTYEYIYNINSNIFWLHLIILYHASILERNNCHINIVAELYLNNYLLSKCY